MSPTIPPEIFQELQARHFRSDRVYRSAGIRIVEVNGPPGGSPKLQSFEIKRNEVPPWLIKIAADSREKESPAKVKLRIMLGSGMRGETGEYIDEAGGTTVENAGPYSPVVAMPFSQDDYDIVARTFTLPTITTLLSTRGARSLRGHFQVHRISAKEENIIFGLTLSSFSSRLVGFRTNVSLSYNLTTGAINALLLGSETPEELVWLEEDLRQLAPLAMHPFLLPTLVCQRLAEKISTSIDKHFDQLHRVEISSGQTGIGILGEDGSAMRPGRCHDPNLSLAILAVAQLAIATEAYIRGHTLTVRSVRDELMAFPWHLLPPSEEIRMKEQSELIVRHLDCISQNLKFSLVRIGHLRQRADVQSAAITNLLAQRNNEATRTMAESSTSIAHDTQRDSSAMKSIAILTMIFLPATFTASYFATPAVMALKPSHGLYWAVTVALTVVVVFVYIVFYKWVIAKRSLAKDFKLV
ncbi:hypothetical protein F5Y19DRAFT_468800 [Xylariaceae sp. FL1651]|nr:hypothetical protein F5Y19DRAFT_468800 [Xylariaceae sp. FL1651]